MYTKTNWVARVGTALNRFLKTNETSTEVELTNDPTGVTTAGTPFTVANMNKIEQGIYDNSVHAESDGKDHSDVVLNNSHRVNTSNPHSVTKEQITGLKSTDSPTFATINTGGLGAFLIGQNLRTTDNVSFANINPPVDNNDATPPTIGMGGFTFATAGSESAILAPSGGTHMYLRVNSTGTIWGCGRIAGGSATAAGTGSGTDYAFFWRLA